MLLLVGLAASTLLSEDAACAAAGLLVRQGRISPWAGVAACAIGIYAGDALLWCVGRLTRAWRSFAPPRAGVVDSPVAILASRFLPGTRLPMYLAAGACGRRPGVFFLWTLVGVLLWTPLIVLGTSASLAAGFGAIAALHVIRRVNWRRVWPRVLARLDRLRRWEFWPAAVLYAPVAMHILRLAMKHGGLGTLSAANPGIPEGGLVGESKAAILAQLPPAWTLDATLIPDGGTEARLDDLRQLLEHSHHELPVVLKPDAGQRGAGVRLVHSLEEARAYFDAQPGAVLVQRYHPGPFEAGVLYCRHPADARGRIVGITDKRFPVLTGDGRSTVEELVWAHPRYRLQGDLFLRRHASESQRVLDEGERLPLTIAGNHCQGTLFLDGAHLVTPALDRRIDEIARSMPGFFVGRFDIRYSSVERFLRGEDLAVVELNGVASEPTHIYDPGRSLFDAWRALCAHWTAVFEIGAANRARGHEPASTRHLLKISLQHLARPPALPIAS